jgi:hypothetical protein
MLRGAPWKQRAGQATKRTTRGPTPQANRGVSGCGPPEGRRSGGGIPELGTGPQGGEGRLELPPTMTRARSQAVRRPRKAA